MQLNMFLKIIIRLICLWCILLAFGRAASVLVIHKLNSLSAVVSLASCLIIIIVSMLICFYSKLVSIYILAGTDKQELVTWSSFSVLCTVVILFGFYGLVINVIPELMDSIMRLVLLAAARQYNVLSEPSIFIPSIFLIIKGGMSMLLIFKSGYIATKALEVSTRTN